jgi:hypothetical protein
MEVESAVTAVVLELSALLVGSLILYFTSTIVQDFRYEQWKWFERWPGLNKRWFDWVGAVILILGIVALFLILVRLNMFLF